MPSTVRIETWNVVNSIGSGRGPVPTKVSSGSGVVYDEERRLIMTNAHVIEPTRGAPGFRSRLKVVFPGGEVREGTVVATDSACDIGLLRVEEARWAYGEDSEPVELRQAAIGRSDDLDRGEAVAVLGAPLGGSLGATVGAVESRAYLADEMPSGFAGHRGSPPLMYTRLLRLAAPVVKGNSGGPVVNAKGEVVAIASSAIQTGADTGSRKPLAIVIEDADAVAKALLAGGKIRRPQLGVSLEAIDEVDCVWRLDDQGAPRDGAPPATAAGLLVRGVAPRGPAEAAGLRVGDVIVRCDGRRTRLKGDVLQALGPVAQPGRALALTVLRWGEGDAPKRLVIRVPLGAK